MRDFKLDLYFVYLLNPHILPKKERVKEKFILIRNKRILLRQNILGNDEMFLPFARTFSID